MKSPYIAEIKRNYGGKYLLSKYLKHRRKYSNSEAKLGPVIQVNPSWVVVWHAFNPCKWEAKVDVCMMWDSIIYVVNTIG